MILMLLVFVIILYSHKSKEWIDSAKPTLFGFLQKLSLLAK